MKGVILAGGLGTRPSPLTKVTNKHLLPVGRKPMLWHPVRQLVLAGIRQIMAVTSADHMGDIVNPLGSTAVNDLYIVPGALECGLIEGGRTDAGTFESLEDVNDIMMANGNRIVCQDAMKESPAAASRPAVSARTPAGEALRHPRRATCRRRHDRRRLAERARR